MNNEPTHGVSVILPAFLIIDIPPTMSAFQEPKNATEQVDNANNVGREKVPQQAEYVPDSAAERAMVRKIDFRILPMLWIMCVSGARFG